MSTLAATIIALIVVAVIRRYAFRGTKAGEMLLDIGLVILIAAMLTSC